MPDQENQSGNIDRNGMVYDPRNQDTLTLANNKRSAITGINIVGQSSAPVVAEKNSPVTEKRPKIIPNTIKSESEEYDSLNSDSDISAERNCNNSRTESDRQLDDHDSFICTYALIIVRNILFLIYVSNRFSSWAQSYISKWW